MSVRIRAWLPVGLWLAFQITLTSIPGRMLPTVSFSWFDTLAHAGLYCVLGALVARAALVEGWDRRGVVVVWVVIVLMGGLDELHQMLVPNRSAEWLDWMADGAGAALGLAAGWFLGRRWARVWAA